MDYKERMAKLIDELRTKLEEADINDQLARTCRELDSFLPLFKERDELTPAEEQRIAELNRKYKEQFDRYKRLKGIP